MHNSPPLIQTNAETIFNIISPTVIKDIVRALEMEYQSTHGLILSEDDIKCLLFSQIETILRDRNQWRLASHDTHIYATPLHTEIKYFDPSGNLIPRPDITILDPRYLKMSQAHGKIIERKGFTFNYGVTAIEIKFCKNKIGFSNKTYDLIKEDCVKLRNLQNWHVAQGNARETFAGIIIVFNKTNKYNREKFNQIITEFNNLTIIYATGNFQ